MGSGRVTNVLDVSTIELGSQRPEFATSSATVISQPVRPSVPRVRVRMADVGDRELVSRITVKDGLDARGDEAALQTFVGTINRLLLNDPVDGDEPTSSAVARRVIELLAMLILYYVDEPPSVYALADGGLQVRWAAPRGSLEIEFYSDGEALAMITRREGAAVTRENGYLEQFWPKAVRWLFAK